MSYDMFMRPRTGEFTRKDFFRYFKDRPHYELFENHVIYENEETGVHFTFDCLDPAGEDEQLEIEDYPASFNLNYCRPTCFFNEAEPELRKFIEHHSMLVFDPQADDTGFREYDADEFRLDWQH